MSEISKLPGDMKTRQTYDEKTKTLHVEQVRTASVKAGSDKITQEEWDAIFNGGEGRDCEEEEQEESRPEPPHNEPQQEGLTGDTSCPKSDSSGGSSSHKPEPSPPCQK